MKGRDLEKGTEKVAVKRGGDWGPRVMLGKLMSMPERLPL